MYGDDYLGWVILIIVLIFLILLVRGTVLIDSIKQKRYDKLQDLKSTHGNEIKPISKKDAIYLIKNCSENPKKDLEQLNKGTHYFIYGFSHEGWLDVAKINMNSLLIAKEFNVEEELKNNKINMSSRILIFNEFDARKKKNNTNRINYILRLVWAIGKIEDDKELLTSIYEREEFKQFLERHEYQLKEPWRLSEDFLRQSQIQKIIQKDSAAFVTTVRTTNLIDRTEQHKMTFKLYEAINGYQVVTKIPGIAS